MSQYLIIRLTFKSEVIHVRPRWVKRLPTTAIRLLKEVERDVKTKKTVISRCDCSTLRISPKRKAHQSGLLSQALQR